MEDDGSDLEIDAGRGFLVNVIESPYPNDGIPEGCDVVKGDIDVLIGCHLRPVGIGAVKCVRSERRVRNRVIENRHRKTCRPLSWKELF